MQYEQEQCADDDGASWRGIVDYLQIAEGVKYLHEHQVVPRDLKASNILVKAADEKSP